MNLQLNPYNSEKFGISMYDVSGLTGLEGESEVSDLLENIDSKVDHISVKIPTDFKTCLNGFLRHGFDLVDTQIEFTRSLGYVPQARVPEGYRIRFFEPQDISVVTSIARASYRIDRWHSDPSLPDNACDEYYAEWVRSCASGYADEILVATYDEVPVGFMTLRTVGDEAGRIDLTAVDAAHRGRGVYRSLVQSALVWADDRGFAEMLATTQINNYGSQRTWEGEGFKSHASWYVLHYSRAYDGGLE